MDTAEKVREGRVRRMIARQGYRLGKSRRRDPRAVDYGAYTISDGSGAVVFGASVKRTLDDCEQWALDGDSVVARSAGSEEWEQVGEVAIDTGTLMLADPCLAGDVLGSGALEAFGDGDHFTHRHANGHGLAVLTSTGYGDGFYPVSVTRGPGDRIAAVRVDFIDSEELRGEN